MFNLKNNKYIKSYNFYIFIIFEFKIISRCLNRILFCTSSYDKNSDAEKRKKAINEIR